MRPTASPGPGSSHRSTMDLTGGQNAPRPAAAPPPAIMLTTLRRVGGLHSAEAGQRQRRNCGVRRAQLLLARQCARTLDGAGTRSGAHSGSGAATPRPLGGPGRDRLQRPAGAPRLARRRRGFASPSQLPLGTGRAARLGARALGAPLPRAALALGLFERLAPARAKPRPGRRGAHGGPATASSAHPQTRSAQPLSCCVRPVRLVGRTCGCIGSRSGRLVACLQR
mmetsp:Transcript_16798/g.63666  ORF Transcript_16798/g.63666 Transcript_16798/m.63666 type:complete len:225 (-) Transcript_16798:181-855(-)